MGYVSAIVRDTMKLSWNMGAFDEIRTDPALCRMVDDVCESIAERAGRGFGWKAEPRKGKRGVRYRGIVYTDTMRARAVNARDNTLLKVLGGA